MNSSVMVVSRYKEDISWLSAALSTGALDSVELYNKGGDVVTVTDPRVRVRDVPNVGREGGTFLDYIIENYSSLPDRLWFAQGDPFDHSPDFIGLLAARDHYRNKAFQSLSVRYKDGYIPPPGCLRDLTAFNVLGNRCAPYFIKDMQIIGHCRFTDHGTELILNDFESKYGTRDAFPHLADLLGIARPRRITEFVYGACFFASGRVISRHPRWVYERARDFLLETDSQGSFQGFVLERFWPYLISGVSYESLSNCYRGVFSGLPIAIYCSGRNRVWIKRGFDGIVLENPSTYAITTGPDGLRFVPGIDVAAPDETSLPASSLAEAGSILFSKVYGPAAKATG